MRIPTNAPNAGGSPSPTPPGAQPRRPVQDTAPAVPTKQPFRRHPLCLLLAVAFAGIIGFFPPAKYSGKEMFIAYLIVMSAIGLLIPLVASAIVYWTFGRSQGAANFTFGLLVALFLSGAVFNMTKAGKEMSTKLEAQVREQIGAPVTEASTPAAPTAPKVVTKGAPEIRVYKKSTASAPEKP